MANLIDLTGKQFGKLTVLYRTKDHFSKNGSRRTAWHCRCSCGNEVDVIGLNLTRNHTKSCGCARGDGRKKLQRDVTGQRFGHLVGIKKVENQGGQTRWLFKCDCGNEVPLYLSNVTTGKTSSCGIHCALKPHTYDSLKKKGYRGDLVGQKFGRLVVLERFKDKNGWTQFRCKCDCGNYKVASGSNLKYGNTKSCGCLHKESIKNCLSENLVGKKFYKLTVLKEVDGKYNKSHWLCKCDCGNETIVSFAGLKSGHTKSCGCYQDEVASNAHFIDLTGKTFGKLYVVERASNSRTGDTRYHCKCECGKETIVHSAPLLDGRTRSCGCWKYSSLELDVLRYFKEKGYVAGVDFECQKEFDNLTGVGDRQLSYDFIFYPKNDAECLIECQGKQHYEAVDWFGGERHFERQQIHDRLKKDYADILGAKLIEIPYTAKSYNEVKAVLEKNGI